MKTCVVAFVAHTQDRALEEHEGDFTEFKFKVNHNQSHWKMFRILFQYRVVSKYYYVCLKVLEV